MENKKCKFVRAIITSTACASSVFLSSHRNTVLNQSACVFALGYFLKLDNIRQCPQYAAEISMQLYFYDYVVHNEAF